jgi:hypothetical protein
MGRCLHFLETWFGHESVEINEYERLYNIILVGLWCLMPLSTEKRFCIFLRYFYFILKLLRRCDILCFSSFHFITEIWRIISYQACIRCYLGILSIYKNCKHRVCIDQIVEVLSIYHEIVWLWVLIKGWNKLQWYIVIDLLSGFAGTWFI